MAELSATKKAEVGLLGILSSEERIHIVACSKIITKFPRKYVFFGTINDDEFLGKLRGGKLYELQRAYVRKNLIEA
jgi:predicted P-loop ATPase